MPVVVFSVTTLFLSLGQICKAAWPKTVRDGDKGYEVALLQSALNEIHGTTLAIDGHFGPSTVSAVKAFQQSKTLSVDGIVGENTWKKVFDGTSRYIIRFKRGSPPSNNAATPENDSLYECSVDMYRIGASGSQFSATYRGSVLPSDMNVRGRVNDGWYLLNLGFHKRSGAPTASDLVVKTNGNLRPCLIVNEDRLVEVTSNDPNKTTSYAIHIHNGFNTDRYSDGCQTISPSHWSSFISHFLENYPALDDWHKNDSYRGREIGVLIIE